MRERAARGEPLPEYKPPAKTPSRKTTAMSTTGSISAGSNASTTSLPLTTTETLDELVRVDSVNSENTAGTSAATAAEKRKVDWGGMRDQALAHAQTGTQWWQMGKQLWKGEKKVEFSWKGASEDWENVSRRTSRNHDAISYAFIRSCRSISLPWQPDRYRSDPMDRVFIYRCIRRKSHLLIRRRAFVSVIYINSVAYHLLTT